MDLKNIFSKLAEQNDYRSLAVFAETLEKSGEYKIADKVINYVKFANIKTAQFQKKYNYDTNHILTIKNNNNHTDIGLNGFGKCGYSYYLFF